jgi:hypothetical protein
MRPLNALAHVTGTELRQRSFWLLLAIVALMGPAFILFGALTDHPVMELRPVLSEPASIADFSSQSNASWTNEEARELFRTPESVPSSESSFFQIFGPGDSSSLSPRRIFAAPWETTIRGSLFDIHRLLLPILMAIVGVLAAPSTRRFALLRIMLPYGRFGRYGAIVIPLVIQVAWIGLAGAAGVCLTLLGLGSNVSMVFIIEYFGAVFAYGLSAALFGLTVAEVVRDRGIAVLLSIVLLIAVAPWLARGLSRIDAWVVQATSSIPNAGTAGHPLYWVRTAILTPPRTTFVWITRTLMLSAAGASPYNESAALMLANWGFRLLVAIGIWFAAGAVAFQRMDRRSP